MGGHLEIVELLAANGSNVNYRNSMGWTPLFHCFSRVTESENMFENKLISLKIAETLLKHGADINRKGFGERTLLNNFCAVTMKLDK